MPASAAKQERRRIEREAQLAAKQQRKAEKLQRPLPSDPLDRMNVLAQRLNFPPPGFEVFEERRFRVILSCTAGRGEEADILTTQEGWGTTVKGAKREAASKLNNRLEREWLAVAGDANAGLPAAQDQADTAGLANALHEVATCVRPGGGDKVVGEGDARAVGGQQVVKGSNHKNGAYEDGAYENGVYEMQGDDEVDWGDEELIPYE